MLNGCPCSSRDRRPCDHEARKVQHELFDGVFTRPYRLRAALFSSSCKRSLETQRKNIIAHLPSM